MNIVNRYKKPTPPFFKILRNIGLALVAGGGAVLAAPITIPAALVAIATYATVAGTVVTAVSQAVVVDDEKAVGTPKKKDDGV